MSEDIKFPSSSFHEYVKLAEFPETNCGTNTTDSPKHNSRGVDVRLIILGSTILSFGILGSSVGSFGTSISIITNSVCNVILAES